MTAVHGPTILLYNPLSGHGHLDSWLAMFARLLLRRGHGVQGLTPGPHALLDRLAQDDLHRHPALRMLPWKAHLRGGTGLGRLLKTCRTVAEGYHQRTPASIPTPDMPPARRLKKQVLQRLVPPVYGLIAPWLPPRDPWDDLPPFGQADMDAGLLDPAEAALRVAAALRQVSRPPDLLCVMYLDMFSLNPARWQAWEQLCPLPWTGVRFVPSTPARLEPYCALPSLRGLCLLDEGQGEAYAAALPGRHVALLPDITYAALPQVEPALVAQLKARARGRRIVFLGGSIGGQKNLARWEGLIRRADPSRWFFAMVGEVHANSLDPEESAALDRLTTAPPEHFWAHGAYVEDEREFNAVIAAASVIFAVYKRFAISSNMPGKAAALERPILAASGYLMGDRVARYGIGRVVPEDDEAAMLAALEDLAATPVPAANFAAYREDFSEDRLAEVLEQHLAQCVAGVGSRI
ncbi:MAG: hypothetical protein LDL27_01815 [Desulfovibrio sp.]|nr:hypothetical protein [Desulfovibrio sp.]